MSELLTYDGRTQTIKQWAIELGYKYSTLRDRLHHGWPIELALTLPVRSQILKSVKYGSGSYHTQVIRPRYPIHDD